jgi:TonB family protein
MLSALPLLRGVLIPNRVTASTHALKRNTKILDSVYIIEASMKVKHQVSKVTSVILMITFFIVSAAQAQQYHQRDNIYGVPVAEPAPPAPPPLPPPPTPINGNELQALAIKRVLPVYPPQAKISRLSGIVIVRMTINKAGDVISAVPLTGDRMLKAVAMRASYGWKWDPALIQDAPHGISGHIRFDFYENATVSINTSTDPGVVDEKEIYKAELLRNLEQDLEQLRVAPSPSLYDKVAQDYFVLNRIEEAVETYKEGISLYPQDLSLYAGWGGIYAKRDLKDEFLKILEQAAQLQIEPNSPIDTRNQFVGFLWLLSGKYIVMDRNVEAKEILERALSLNPSEKYKSHLYSSLGLASIKLGNKKLAITMADKLLELREKDTAIGLLTELYKKLLKLGDKKSAKEVMVLAGKVCRMTVYKPITR